MSIGKGVSKGYARVCRVMPRGVSCRVVMMILPVGTPKECSRRTGSAGRTLSTASA